MSGGSDGDGGNIGGKGVEGGGAGGSSDEGGAAATEWLYGSEVLQRSSTMHQRDQEERRATLEIHGLFFF